MEKIAYSITHSITGLSDALETKVLALQNNHSPTAVKNLLQ